MIALAPFVKFLKPVQFDMLVEAYLSKTKLGQFPKKPLSKIYAQQKITKKKIHQRIFAQQKIRRKFFRKTEY